MIRGRIEGLTAFRNKMSGMAKKYATKTDNVLRAQANETAQTARSKCILPYIRSEIFVLKTESGYSITTQSKESAYLEFGTGRFAERLLAGYPQDWIEMAWQFYIDGSGTTEAAPYLFPAYQRAKEDVIKKIKDAIE